MGSLAKQRVEKKVRMKVLAKRKFAWDIDLLSDTRIASLELIQQ